jgi:transposase
VIGMPLGTRVWIAAGITDMRKGMGGLAALVETALGERPFSGDVFAVIFRHIGAIQFSACRSQRISGI